MRRRTEDTERNGWSWGSILDSLDRLSDVGGVISGLSILLMTLLIFVSVIARYVLNAPLASVIELSGYLMVLVVYAGLGYTFRKGAFIRTDVVYGRLRGRLRRFVDVLIRLIAFAFLLIMDIYIWQHVSKIYASQQTSIGFLQTPLYLPHGIIAIGLSIFTLQILVSLIRILSGAEDEAEAKTAAAAGTNIVGDMPRE